ncbi:MAG: hypothetical protein U0N41_04785 [Agathobaculum butyriciproducens]
MHDDLTAQDIEMMQKELDHRKLELMPELIEEVKRTRAFGVRPRPEKVLLCGGSFVSGAVCSAAAR